MIIFCWYTIIWIQILLSYTSKLQAFIWFQITNNNLKVSSLLDINKSNNNHFFICLLLAVSL